MAAKKKTLDERIVALFKTQAEDAEYELNNLDMPTEDYEDGNAELSEIMEELAGLAQKTKDFAVKLTKEDERTIKEQLDDWCLSASAKASIRKALKI